MLSEQQKSDFEWFKAAMPALYAAYGHCYVIVRKEEVVGTFGDFDEAVDCALSSYEPRTFIVQEVGPDEGAYTQEFASMWVTA
ncbi:MAG: hypothetical protein IKG18_02300 [Atopobiaceae bacterium]|nr:hypothetical protein [Atopobiaceae bacterium]